MGRALAANVLLLPPAGPHMLPIYRVPFQVHNLCQPCLQLLDKPQAGPPPADAVSGLLICAVLRSSLPRAEAPVPAGQAAEQSKAERVAKLGKNERARGPFSTRFICVWRCQLRCPSCRGERCLGLAQGWVWVGPLGEHGGLVTR